MNDQVRAVVFILLALLVLFSWQHFYKPPVPALQPATTGTSQVSPAGGVGQQAPAGGQASASSALTATAAGKPSAIPTAQAVEEKTVVVESALYRVELSNRGGLARSWKLKKYL